jgi:hypothetical protein
MYIRTLSIDKYVCVRYSVPLLNDACYNTPKPKKNDYCDATKTRPPRNQTRAAWEMEYGMEGALRVMGNFARNIFHNE